MYLQLAEGENNGNYSALAESVFDNYVFIPANFLPEFSKDSYVRADYFTKYDPTTANAVLNALAPYQTATLNEGAVSTAVSLLPLPGAGAAAKGIDLAKKLIANRQAAVAAGTKKPLFKGLFNKAATQTPTQQEKKFPDINVSADVDGQQFGVTYKKPEEQQPTFFQKYKTPLLIGGGLLVVGLGYMLLKKKK